MNPSTIQGPTQNSLATATETVNSSDGNVMVSIPLLARKGTSGLDFNLALAYESKDYDLVQTGEPGVWASLAWGTTNSFGIDFGHGRLSIPSLHSENLVVDTIDVGQTEPAQITCDTQFQFRDVDGSIHAFDNAINCYQSNSGPYPLRNRTVIDTLDGSMMRLDLSDPANAKIILKNGTAVLFDLTDQSSDNGVNNRYRRYAKSITDKYGNAIQFSGHPSTEMTVTDTVGRQVKISNATHRITYKNSNGGDTYIDLTSSTASGDPITLHADDCHFGGPVQPGGDRSNSVASHDSGGSNHLIDSISIDSQGDARTFVVDLDGINEVSKVTYPTGGYTRYTYTTQAGSYAVGDYVCFQYPIREVSTKNVCESATGACTTEKTTNYSPVLGAGPASGAAGSSNATMTVTEPADDIGHRRKTISEFSGPFSGTGGMRMSRETKVSIYDNSTTLLETTETSYTSYVGSSSSDVIWSSRPKDVTVTHLGASATAVQATRTHYDYDPVTLVIGAPSVSSTYQVYSDQPKAITVYDSADNVLQTTSLTWKNTGNYTPSGNHILDLLSSKTVTSSDNVSVTDSFVYDTVGRMSSSTKGGSDVSDITTTYEVDTAGRTTKVTDSLSNVTKPSYGSSTDSPWYDKSCSVGTTSPQPHIIENALGQKVTAKYYSCTGLLASVKDANDQTTIYTYDSLGRLLNTSYPDGGITYREYTSANELKTTVKQTISISPVTKTITDGLGRVIEAQKLSDPACSGSASHVVTTYDALGRVISTSNPYCVTTDTTYGVKQQSYDALDRPTITTNADSSIQQTCYNNMKTDTRQTVCRTIKLPGTNADTPWTDSQDEAGIRSQHLYDAFGRLTHVYEDPSGIGLHTKYGYNGFGNLTSVTQDGVAGETARIRMFQYDSLSRLTRACNPESLPSTKLCDGVNNWSQTYSYDSNGNVTSKKDARSTTTNYNYDKLNRLTWKHYSDGSDPVGYGYDGNDENGSSFVVAYGLTNTAGRLTYVSNERDAGMMYSYDPMGRVVGERLCLPDLCGYLRMFTAAYDYAGNLTDLTYPDARHIRNSYDEVGRLKNVEMVDWNGYTAGLPFAYFNQLTYYPDGTPSKTVYTGGFTTETKESSRNQVTSIAASQVNSFWGGQTFLSRQYCYTASCLDATQSNGGLQTSQTANNGSILQIKDLLNSGYTQGYTYDSLNRIIGFTSGGVWPAKSYQIDSFGNLSEVNAGGPVLTFNANNRISNMNCTGPGGKIFDDAGNLTCDGNTAYGTLHQYVFDRENRVISVNNNSTTYTYDGDGNRVRKTNQDGTWEETLYFQGQPMALLRSDGNYTDYLYANGRKFAIADEFPMQIHLHTNFVASSGSRSTVAAVPLNFSHVVRQGDVLAFRQFQTGPACGGLMLDFRDSQNNNSNGNWVLTDQNSTFINASSTTGVWEKRFIRLDTPAFLGKTLTAVHLLSEQCSGNGSVDLYVADAAFSNPDGTVETLYNGQAYGLVPSFYLGDQNGVTGFFATTERSANANDRVQPWVTTHYLVSDHLGSSTLEMASVGEWPVAVSKFDPFGQQIEPASYTANPYKFTGKERDAESGLDYFGARYYNSSMGRWMSPDWSAKAVPIPYADLYSPQSLNLYGYLGNSPLSGRDIDGHMDWLRLINVLRKAGRSLISRGETQVGQVVTGEAEFSWRDSDDCASFAKRVGSGLNTAASIIVPALVTDGLSLESEEISGLGALVEETSVSTELSSAAGRAVQTVGPGQGAVYGTRVHSAFEAEVNGLGNPNLSTEVSYLNGQVVPRGTTGSVRVDVIEGPKTSPTAAYDLKTGQANLTSNRIQQIQSHLPGGNKVPVHEVRP